MRTTIALTALACSLTLSSSALAQKPPDPQAVRRAEILAAVDANTDGQITEDEFECFLRSALPRAGFDSLITTAASARAMWKQVLGQCPTCTTAGQAFFQGDTIALLDNAELTKFLTFGQLIPAQKVRQPKPLSQRIGDWLQIRKSFLDENAIGQPAKASFATYATSDETVDAAKQRRQWSIHGSIVANLSSVNVVFGGLELYPVLAYEANLDSGLKTNADKITHRAGLAGSFLRSNGLFAAHTFSLTYDWTTDQKYKASYDGGTFQYTPVVPNAAIGRFAPRTSPVRFRWRPYAGVTFGQLRNANDISDFAKLPNFTDAFVRAESELALGDRVSLKPEVSSFRQFRGDKQTHSVFDFTADYYITPQDAALKSSIELTVAVGRRSPDFQKEQNVAIALTVKF